MREKVIGKASEWCLALSYASAEW